MKVYAKGYIKDGRLTMDNTVQFVKDIKLMDDGRVEVVVRPLHKEHKNRRVENLLFGVVLKEIAEVTGDDPESLYETYKDMFLHGKSSTELSEKEYNEFVDKVIRHGIQFHGCQFKRLHGAS